MNRRRVLLSTAALAISGLMASGFAQSSNRIPLAQLESMFRDMRRKTKWNVDGPLLWGYFFVDPSREKLSKLADQLRAAGYSIVEIRRVPESSVMHQLHVERIELHTPGSLHDRNSELYDLAARLGVESYDGMDVGPALARAK